MNQLRMPIAIASLAAVVGLLPQAAFAEADPRIGMWKLDVAKSTYQQGTAPRGETRSYLATNDGGIQLTAEVVLVNGTKQPTGYRAKYDGKDHPYSGQDGDTIAITADGWTTDATIKMHGKVMRTTHNVVSKDGKTMTVTTKRADGDAVSTRIYNKQ